MHLVTKMLITLTIDGLAQSTDHGGSKQRFLLSSKKHSADSDSDPISLERPLATRSISSPEVALCKSSSQGRRQSICHPRRTCRAVPRASAITRPN